MQPARRMRQARLRVAGPGALGPAADTAAGKGKQQTARLLRALTPPLPCTPPPLPRPGQIVETEHLLKALLEQPNGLARRLVAKAGSDPSRLLDKVDAFIRRQPRVSGDTAQQVRRSAQRGSLAGGAGIRGCWWAAAAGGPRVCGRRAAGAHISISNASTPARRTDDAHLGLARLAAAPPLTHTHTVPRTSPPCHLSTQVLGRNLEGVVNAAMGLRDKMGDSFVSVEHLVLALADDARCCEGLFKGEGLSRAKLDEAVKEVRGGGLASMSPCSRFVFHGFDGTPQAAACITHTHTHTHAVARSHTRARALARAHTRCTHACPAPLYTPSLQVRGSNKVTDQDPEGKYEALSKYARDLTAAAREGKLDPVIGRDDEIRRAIQILSRRTKNNPVLIGEPGEALRLWARRTRAGVACVRGCTCVRACCLLLLGTH